MGVLGSALRVCFAVSLLIPLILCNLVCHLLLCCLGERACAGVALVLFKGVVSFAILVSPWIGVTGQDGVGEQWALMQQLLEDDDPRPIFILSNHTSFFDTILCCAILPVRIIYRSRTYMASYLVDMPVLGTVIRAMGHFPVSFTGKKDGDFSVDRAKMAETQTRVDAHIAGGGALCFFPEGQLNSTPSEIMPFRYGGMKTALAVDARLFQLVTSGCPDVWPKTAAVGGFPGTVRYGVQPLATDGCKALVAGLRAQTEGGAQAAADHQTTHDHELLATYARGAMQAHWSQLTAERGGEGVGKTAVA